MITGISEKLSQHSQCLKSIEFRHHDIEQDKIWQLRTNGIQGFQTAVRFNGLYDLRVPDSF